MMRLLSVSHIGTCVFTGGGALAFALRAVPQFEEAHHTTVARLLTMVTDITLYFVFLLCGLWIHIRNISPS